MTESNRPHGARAQRKSRIDLERRAEIGREKRARTRKLVLEVAFSLLGCERGLTTRVDEICKAAGLGRATFYSYFTSMDELLDALSYELNHDFNRAVDTAVNQMPTAAERVSAAIRYYLDRAVKDPKWAWAMVNISAGGPIFGADTYEHAERTAIEGIAAGEFDLTEADTGRDLQLGAGLAAMITQLRNPPSPAYVTSVARHVLRGMGVPKERVEEIIAQPLQNPFELLEAGIAGLRSGAGSGNRTRASSLGS